MRADGSLTVSPTRQDAQPAPRVVLPATYVAEHVELGYATTITRAQGVTVDEAHLVVGPATTRESLYVGMTRGRHANHAHVHVHPADPGPDPSAATPADVLAQALTRSSAQLSATEQLHRHARASRGDTMPGPQRQRTPHGYETPENEPPGYGHAPPPPSLTSPSL